MFLSASDPSEIAGKCKSKHFSNYLVLTYNYGRIEATPDSAIRESLGVLGVNTVLVYVRNEVSVII